MTTTRGLITCDYTDDDIECCETATWTEEPPPRTSTANVWWCDDHLPAKCYDGWKLIQVRQELSDGGVIWYPSYLVDGYWVSWSYNGIIKQPIKKWWQLWK